MTQLDEHSLSQVTFARNYFQNNDNFNSYQQKMLSKGTDPQIVMEPSQDSVLPRPTPSSKPNIKAQDVMKQYKARISAQSDDKAVSSSATNEVNEAEVISSPPTPFDIIPKPKFSDE